MISSSGGPVDDVATLRRRVNAELGVLVEERDPADLYDAARYALSSGGKRLRPLIVLLTARGFGAGVETALPAALSVEVFHNFTLVHDDIMDHSSERRGRPTVHVKWNQDVAILAGDYLLSLSYKLLAGSPPVLLPEAMSVFTEMVNQLCEGQMLDKNFESRRDVTVDDYFQMIDAKTGALLRACMELGGLVGGADAGERLLLRESGQFVGRAFQLQDDLLDVVANDQRWGKKVGGDLAEGKRTYLLLQSLESLDGTDRALFEKVMNGRGLDPDEIPEARALMIESGVVDETRARIEEYTRVGLERLSEVAAGRDLDPVAKLFARMMVRAH